MKLTPEEVSCTDLYRKHKELCFWWCLGGRWIHQNPWGCYTYQSCNDACGRFHWIYQSNRTGWYRQLRWTLLRYLSMYRFSTTKINVTSIMRVKFQFLRCTKARILRKEVSVPLARRPLPVSAEDLRIPRGVDPLWPQRKAWSSRCPWCWPLPA